MHPLKFLEATRIPPVREAGNSVKSAACRETLATFKSNMEIVCGLTTLPGFTFWTATEWMIACTRAKRETVGEHATQKHITESAQIIGPLAERYMSQAMRVGLDKQVEHLVETTTMFLTFTMAAGPYAHGVLENLLKSILVQAWGAFEVLAEDLLIGAVEKHPQCFDPSRITKKFHFRKRISIRESYGRAFESDSAIVTCVSDSSVDALSVLRNVLVHKSGVADSMFLTEVARIPLLAPFRGLKPGSAVNISGDNVFSIITPTVGNGYTLVKAVDDWLAARTP